MSEVKIYLKPGPVSAIYKNANYLPFQWNPDFKYGPFFPGYGTHPSDATEEYTIHSLELSARIAAFLNELVPSLQTEVPKIARSQWPSLPDLGRTKLKPVARFLCESKSHVDRLYQGDHTLLPEMHTDLEWDELFFSVLARGDAKLRDDDTELEIFVWAYMHYMVFYFCSK